MAAGDLDPQLLSELAGQLGVPGVDLASALAGSPAAEDLKAGRLPSPEAIAQLGAELGVPGPDLAAQLAEAPAVRSLLSGGAPPGSTLAQLAQELGVPGAELAGLPAVQSLLSGQPPAPASVAQLAQELGVPGAELAAQLAASPVAQSLLSGQAPSLSSMAQLGEDLGVPGADLAGTVASGQLPAGHSIPPLVPESWTMPELPPPQVPGTGPDVGPGWFIIRRAGIVWAPAVAFGMAAPVDLGLKTINLELTPGPLLPHHEFLVLVGSVSAVLDQIPVTLGQWDFLTCPPNIPRVFAPLMPPCAMLVL